MPILLRDKKISTTPEDLSTWLKSWIVLMSGYSRIISRKSRIGILPLVLIIKGLQELGDYARNTRVTVLMESHGELIHSADLKKNHGFSRKRSRRDGLGYCQYVVGNQRTSRGRVSEFEKIHSSYTHKRRQIRRRPGTLYIAGPGRNARFSMPSTSWRRKATKDFYSFEWEKMWHPEIAAPRSSSRRLPAGNEETFRHITISSADILRCFNSPLFQPDTFFPFSRRRKWSTHEGISG